MLPLGLWVSCFTKRLRGRPFAGWVTAVSQSQLPFLIHCEKSPAWCGRMDDSCVKQHTLTPVQSHYKSDYSQNINSSAHCNGPALFLLSCHTCLFLTATWATEYKAQLCLLNKCNTENNGNILVLVLLLFLCPYYVVVEVEVVVVVVLVVLVVHVSHVEIIQHILSVGQWQRSTPWSS